MRVLVAEDSALTRHLLRKALTVMGHECILTSDGNEAWQEFQRAGAEVIISDRMMPRMDGMELCRRIRASSIGEYTYFIFLTALSDKREMLEGLYEGADDYLAKPIDLDELQARLIAANRVTTLHRRLAEQAQSLERSNVALYEMARTDPLTGLGNRLHLLEMLGALHAAAERYGRPYGVAMCDLDRFKLYNDAFGHQGGDQALRTVADVLRRTTRGTDGVFRYGGEELVVILPEQTLASAEQAANRIRQAVAAVARPHPHNTPFGIVTLSIGVSGFSGDRRTSFDTVIAEADEALYAAKRAGRNRVALAGASVTHTH